MNRVKSFFLMMYRKAVLGLKWVSSSEAAHKAVELGFFLADLMPYAMTAVRVVAEIAGPDRAAGLKRLYSWIQQSPGVDLDRPLSELEINTLLSAAARLLARRELEDAIEAAGAAGLLVGARYIKSATEIPDRVVDTAVQNAYLLLRNVVNVQESK